MASITPGRNPPSSSHPAAPRPHSERRWRPQHPWGHAPSAISPMMPPPQHVVGVRPSAAEPAVEGVRSAQAKRSPVSSAEARAGGRGGFPGLRFSSDNDGDPDGHPCLPRQQRRRLPAGQQPGVLGRDAPPLPPLPRGQHSRAQGAPRSGSGTPASSEPRTGEAAGVRAGRDRRKPRANGGRRTRAGLWASRTPRRGGTHRGLRMQARVLGTSGPESHTRGGRAVPSGGGGCAHGSSRPGPPGRLTRTAALHPPRPA